MPANTPLTDHDLLNAGYRYGLSLSGSRQDAEDLVHDAWIKLTRRYQQSPDKPLLFRTIRNLYIDRIRHQNLVSAHEENVRFVLSPDDERDIERDYISAEEMQYQLSRLRDVESEALYLSVVEGYTADEIASLTASSRGTVLSLIHRTKHKLREWFQDADQQDNVVPLSRKRNGQ